MLYIYVHAFVYQAKHIPIPCWQFRSPSPISKYRLQPHSKALHKCEATKLLEVFFLHLMNRPLTEFGRLLGTMCSNTQTSCIFAIFSPLWAAVQAACPAYSWASSLASHLCPPGPSLLVGFQAAFWELMEIKVLREEREKNRELVY